MIIDVIVFIMRIHTTFFYLLLIACTPMVASKDNKAPIHKSSDRQVKLSTTNKSITFTQATLKRSTMHSAIIFVISFVIEFIIICIDSNFIKSGVPVLSFIASLIVPLLVGIAVGCGMASKYDKQALSWTIVLRSLGNSVIVVILYFIIGHILQDVENIKTLKILYKAMVLSFIGYFFAMLIDIPIDYLLVSKFPRRPTVAPQGEMTSHTSS